METLIDTARFRDTDPDALVYASLACPICLGVDEASWAGSLHGHDPWVDGWCARCAERWRVYLEPRQALRLALMETPMARVGR
jgi:hypothetical protein